MSKASEAAAAAAASRAEYRAAMIGEAQARMRLADEPVVVAAEALALVDRLRPSLPTGGGLAAHGAAQVYAEAVIEALTAYPKGSLPMIESEWFNVEDTDVDEVLSRVEVIDVSPGEGDGDVVTAYAVRRWSDATLRFDGGDWRVDPGDPASTELLSPDETDLLLQAAGLHGYPSDADSDGFMYWRRLPTITEGAIRSVSLVAGGPEAGAGDAELVVVGETMDGEPVYSRVPAPVPDVASLAAENAARRASVEAEIDRRVQLRLDNNAEIGRLRAALVALNAAGRHFNKLEGDGR